LRCSSVFVCGGCCWASVPGVPGPLHFGLLEPIGASSCVSVVGGWWLVERSNGNCRTMTFTFKIILVLDIQ
jgi:hypothetical protein